MKMNWTGRIIVVILMSSLSQFSLLSANDDLNKVVISKKTKLSEDEIAAAKVADLKLELSMTQEELKFLRKELADVLEQSDKRDQDYLRLQMSVAASIAKGDKRLYDKQSAVVIKSLNSVTNAGEDLIICASEVCDYMKNILDHETITDIEKARAKLRLSRLKEKSEKFHMRIKNRPKESLFQSCRILNVNDKMQIVVLNVGTTSGMNNGIFLKTKDGQFKFTVVLVRQFISAAVVTKGNIKSLSKGMSLIPGR